MAHLKKNFDGYILVVDQTPNWCRFLLFEIHGDLSIRDAIADFFEERFLIPKIFFPEIGVVQVEYDEVNVLSDVDIEECMRDQKREDEILMKRNLEIARIKEVFQRDADGNVNFDKLKGSSLDDLELTVRTYNFLRRSGIDTVWDLIHCTKEGIHKFRNKNQRIIDEIEQKLALHGLRLTEVEPRQLPSGNAGKDEPQTEPADEVTGGKIIDFKAELGKRRY